MRYGSIVQIHEIYSTPQLGRTSCIQEPLYQKYLRINRMLGMDAIERESTNVFYFLPKAGFVIKDLYGCTVC